jgi:hypothetical protein
MTNLITHKELNTYKSAGTRTIRMPNGSSQDVRMPPEYWELFDALKVLEGFNETDIAVFALEEAALQNTTFDRGFRGCVAHLASRWTA